MPANVTVSTRITQALCRARAQTLRLPAETYLTGEGSNGSFVIGHGGDKSCAQVHGQAFDGGFWLSSDHRACLVFVTRAGNHRNYMGAGLTGGSYRGTGHCLCGGGH
jgi:hypothetical protein